jgi:hypothetical protein
LRRGGKKPPITLHLVWVTTRYALQALFGVRRPANNFDKKLFSAGLGVIIASAVVVYVLMLMGYVSQSLVSPFGNNWNTTWHLPASGYVPQFLLSFLLR